jgi:hypothetical protein
MLSVDGSSSVTSNSCVHTPRVRRPWSETDLRCVSARTKPLSLDLPVLNEALTCQIRCRLQPAPFSKRVLQSLPSDDEERKMHGRVINQKLVTD